MMGFSPLEKESEILKGTAPAMAYGGEEPFGAWQEKAREKLRELLGLDRHAACDFDFSIEYRKEEDDFFDTRFAFQSEPGYHVPCHLLEPKEKTYEKPPLMICPQGHSTGMHILMGRVKYPGDRFYVESSWSEFIKLTGKGDEACVNTSCGSTAT